MDNALLQLLDLRVNKAGRAICHVPQLSVERGERVVFIGPNGSGKTTLLRLLGGLETEFTGDYQSDVPVRDCVYVHQSPFLFRGSVMSNVAYGLSARKIPRRQRTSVAREWLKTFGVDHLARRQCAHLSGGEQRRVALARAFATKTRLLLLDEPLADLDQEGIDIVCQAISTASMSTILMSSPVPLPDTLSAKVYCLRSS